MGIARIKLISIKIVTRAWRLPASRFHVYYAVVLVIFFNCIATNAWSKAGGGFDIIALGTEGGLRSGNLSAYLIGPHGQSLSVACDAGNLIDGIEAAVDAGNFSATIRPKDYPLSLTGYILREHIKGYLITHGHLDHIAGLIIASPDDSAKPIYALDPVLQTISQSYFNWQSWPNFAASGLSPQLGKYTYVSLAGSSQQELLNTPMLVTALPLNHNGIVSTAFIIEYKQDIVVCLGDTGADSIQKSDNLKNVWQFIKSKVREGRLKAIIIESSFTNEKPNDSLFGHLTPKLVNQELLALAAIVGEPKLLKDLPVIISHIKPSLAQGQRVQDIMLQQLELGNTLDVDFIIPKQGERWHF
ncbi:MBL fold metallo-hydrolase [Brumicola pallidula]|uniref:Probable 3',5'-cyclic-nucleotide phosphodiesterase n=1 Tax=Brumicola pallidula DSM 14239 = ACAM 615 TaxID=1121922 RepID=K6ZEX9_9ALTE|nr:3',5'-cyclic-nucleotide phosphodiesterase [Glaciecola pallidula]GAC27483.1 probable 3',5'-cyclic-nucleotide phosphodiesterase [Glaciecola pallidula DSM 14239 = ACAM 615]